MSDSSKPRLNLYVEESMVVLYQMDVDGTRYVVYMTMAPQDRLGSRPLVLVTAGPVGRGSRMSSFLTVEGPSHLSIDYLAEKLDMALCHECGMLQPDHEGDPSTVHEDGCRVLMAMNRPCSCRATLGQMGHEFRGRAGYTDLQNLTRLIAWALGATENAGKCRECGIDHKPTEKDVIAIEGPASGDGLSARPFRAEYRA